MLQLLYDTTLFTIVYTILFAASMVIGYVLGLKRYKKKHMEWTPTGVESGIISFYGLVLSFVLIMAGNSSKERNQLIHDHINELETLHNNAFYLPDSTRQIIDEELIRTIDIRLKMEMATRSDFELLCDKVEQEHIYARSLALARKDISLSDLNRITQNMTNAISLHYRIKQSYIERTPVQLLLVLIVGSWLIGILVGFMSGVNPSHNFMVPLVYFMMTLVIILTIHDLDNPQSGIIRPSYQGYELLKEQLLKSH